MNNGSKQGIALTIGSFDGIHLGHRYLISKLINIAKEYNCLSQVITFDPCPKILLGRKKDCIYPAELNREILLEQGVDEVKTIKTTRDFLKLSPQQFFASIYNENLKHIIVGSNFHFGHKACGDVGLLDQLCKIHKVKLTVLDLSSDEKVVSSTRIKELLERGLIQKAKKLLGGNLVLVLDLKEICKRHFFQYQARINSSLCDGIYSCSFGGIIMVLIKNGDQVDIYSKYNLEGEIRVNIISLISQIPEYSSGFIKSLMKKLQHC